MIKLNEEIDEKYILDFLNQKYKECDTKGNLGASANYFSSLIRNYNSVSTIFQTPVELLKYIQ